VCWLLGWLQKRTMEWKVVTVWWEVVKTLVKMVKMVMMMRIRVDKCIGHK